MTEYEDIELNELRLLQKRQDRFMSQSEQDRMDFLIKKKKNNTCVNPKCLGSYSETNKYCEKCGWTLYKMDIHHKSPIRYRYGLSLIKAKEIIDLVMKETHDTLSGYVVEWFDSSDEDMEKELQDLKKELLEKIINQ